MCGRSRNMAWMFLCTYCATGTKVLKAESKQESNEESKQVLSKEEQTQRAFLSCDLCAQKMTESYYCALCQATHEVHALLCVLSGVHESFGKDCLFGLTVQGQGQRCVCQEEEEGRVPVLVPPSVSGAVISWVWMPQRARLCWRI